MSVAGMREQLGPFLDRLIVRLRANEFEVSVEQIIEANDLRVARFWSGGTVDADFLKYSLASIFCGTPEEQARFYEVFDSLSLPDAEEAPGTEAPVDGAAKRRDPLRRHARRRRIWPVVLSVLLAVALIGALFALPWPQSPDPPARPATSAGSAGGDAAPASVDSRQAASLEFTPPPRPPATPQRLRPTQKRAWRAVRWGLAALPLLITIAWLIGRFGARRIFLGEHRTRMHPQLKPLPIAQARGRLFGEADINRSVAVLRVPARYPTRRLDSRASAKATARSGGLPAFVYARLARRPGYVMLLQQRTPLDMFTRLAGKLADRLYNAGLEVSSFVFEGRPARLFPHGQTGRDASYEQVAQVHQGDALIVAGDAALLRQGARASATPWVPGHGEWTSAALLSSRPEALWGRHERSLREHDFAIARFGSAGLGAVRDWLNPQRMRGREEQAPWVVPEAAAAGYPPLLRDAERRWLRDRMPQDTPQLLEQLQAWLGDDGMLLLAAVAVYPHFTFDIALFLEQEMFAGDDLRRREERLFRVTTLPWCRLGRMPVYLRERLLRRDPAHLELIQRCYRKLLHGNLRGDPEHGPSITVAVPEGEAWLAFLRDMLSTARGGAYTDAIFQNVLLEPPDRLTQIELPRQRADELGGQRWQDAARFALVRMAQGTAGAAVLFAALALIVKPIGEAWLENRNVTANGKITVQILYPAGGGSTGYTAGEAQAIAALARRLEFALDAKGFATALLPTVPSGEGASDVPASAVQRLLYADEARDATVPAHVVQFDPDFGISRLRQLGISLNSLRDWLPGVPEPAQTRLLAVPAVPNSAFAQQVADALAWLTYDNPVEFRSPDLAEEPTSRPAGLAGVFANIQDALGDAEYYPPSTIRVWLRTPVRSFQDRLAKGGLGPIVTVLTTRDLGGLDEAQQEVLQSALSKSGISTPTSVSVALAKYETSFAQYDRFARATGRALPDDNGWGRGDRPVINVTRADAMAYADWLSSETGVLYALPSRAIWQQATGAVGLVRPDAGLPRSLLSADAELRTRPVGAAAPNALDLYGLAGNVSEWSGDCATGPTGITDRGGNPLDAPCLQGLLLGGNWRDGESVEQSEAPNDSANAWTGFRVARLITGNSPPAAAR